MFLLSLHNFLFFEDPDNDRNYDQAADNDKGIPVLQLRHIFKSKKVLQNEKGADKQLLSVHIQNIYYFAFFTVSVIFTDLVLPFFKVTVALIVTVPAFLVVIVPFLLTVATDFLLPQ